MLPRPCYYRRLSPLFHRPIIHGSVLFALSVATSLLSSTVVPRVPSSHHSRLRPRCLECCRSLAIIDGRGVPPSNHSPVRPFCLECCHSLTIIACGSPYHITARDYVPLSLSPPPCPLITRNKSFAETGSSPPHPLYLSLSRSLSLALSISLSSPREQASPSLPSGS